MLSQGDWWRLAGRHLGRSPSVPRCGRASHHPSPLYTSTCHWAGDNSSESDHHRGGGEVWWVQSKRASEGLSRSCYTVVPGLCSSLDYTCCSCVNHCLRKGSSQLRDMVWIHTLWKTQPSVTSLYQCFYWFSFLSSFQKMCFIYSSLTFSFLQGSRLLQSTLHRVGGMRGAMDIINSKTRNSYFPLLTF